MNATQTFGLALCLALLPSYAAVRAQEGGRPTRLTAESVRNARVEEMKDEILGLWEIRRMRTQSGVFQDNALVGYMLIAPDYLSLEFHIEEFSKDRGLEGIEMLFQSGIHEWKFSSLAELEMVSVIGTDGTTGQWPEFEAPGKKRQFRIQIGGGQMRLERGNLQLDLVRLSQPEYLLAPPLGEAEEPGRNVKR